MKCVSLWGSLDIFYQDMGRKACSYVLGGGVDFEKHLPLSAQAPTSGWSGDGGEREQQQNSELVLKALQRKQRQLDQVTQGESGAFEVESQRWKYVRRVLFI